MEHIKPLRKKNGFDRSTFMTAFTQSGIPTNVADKMIERMKAINKNGGDASYCRAAG